jgi:hypothetical protein
LLNDGQYAKLQNALAHLTLCVLNIHKFLIEAQNYTIL